MLTTLEMIASLSAGTFSHALNAAIICPRISFPGMEKICVNGSRRAYKAVSYDCATRERMFTDRLICLRPRGRLGKNLPYVERRITLAGAHDGILLGSGTLPFVCNGEWSDRSGSGRERSQCWWTAKSRCGTDAVPSITDLVTSQDQSRTSLSLKESIPGIEVKSKDRRPASMNFDRTRIIEQRTRTSLLSSIHSV